MILNDVAERSDRALLFVESREIPGLRDEHIDGTPLTSDFRPTWSRERPWRSCSGGVHAAVARTNTEARKD